MSFKKLTVAMAVAGLLAVTGCASTPAATEEPTADAVTAGCEVDAAAEQISEDAAKRIQELCEAAKDAGEVELNMISGSTKDMQATYDAFTERFGIKVNPTNEIDPALTANLQGQLQSGNHVTDIVHNPNGHKYVAYAEAYEVESFTVPEELESSADQLQAPDNMYTTPFLGFFGLGTFLPRAGELAPKTWADLAKPEYAGLVGMGDPTVPGPTQDAPVYLMLNGGFNEEIMTGVLSNAAANVKGTYGDTVAGLMQGQYAFMFAAPSSTVYLASKDGAPVKFSLMEEDNYTVTHKQLLIKNAPNPNAAKLWLEWINTMDAGKALASSGFSPLNTNAAADAEAEQPWANWKNGNITEIIAYQDVDAARPDLINTFKQLLGK